MPRPPFEFTQVGNLDCSLNRLGEQEERPGSRRATAGSNAIDPESYKLNITNFSERIYQPETECQRGNNRRTQN